jgi:acyl-CoA dehydrogenase
VSATPDLQADPPTARHTDRRPGDPFSEEHDALRASVRRFVEAELAPHADEWEAAGRFPDEVFRRMGELGFLGLSMPEDVGGAGGDYWATVVLFEELPRSRTGSIPMAIGVQTDMATPPIAQFGTPEQVDTYLRPELAGERIACLGITEPGAGSNVAGVTTRARRDGADWVLDGEKVYITNGVRADFITLVARTAPPAEGDPWSGISLFLVDTDTPGFEVASELDKVGMRSSDTALIRLTDVHVPGEALLGVEGEGFRQIMWELQGERLVGAIGTVAGAQLTFERTLAWTRQRKAFGRALTGFQVTRHTLVDMAADIEQVRRLTYDCCDRWNRGVYATDLIAMCKLASAELGFSVADRALQLFGGHGYAAESEVSRSFRDSRLNRIGGGTDEVQREIVAKLMGL